MHVVWGFCLGLWHYTLLFNLVRNDDEEFATVAEERKSKGRGLNGICLEQKHKAQCSRQQVYHKQEQNNVKLSAETEPNFSFAKTRALSGRLYANFGMRSRPCLEKCS